MGSNKEIERTGILMGQLVWKAMEVPNFSGSKKGVPWSALMPYLYLLCLD
jgi:hypothetical protein